MQTFTIKTGKGSEIAIESGTEVEFSLNEKRFIISIKEI